MESNPVVSNQRYVEMGKTLPTKTGELLGVIPSSSSPNPVREQMQAHVQDCLRAARYSKEKKFSQLLIYNITNIPLIRAKYPVNVSFSVAQVMHIEKHNQKNITLSEYFLDLSEKIELFLPKDFVELKRRGMPHLDSRKEPIAIRGKEELFQWISDLLDIYGESGGLLHPYRALIFQSKNHQNEYSPTAMEKRLIEEGEKKKEIFLDRIVKGMIKLFQDVDDRKEIIKLFHAMSTQNAVQEPTAALLPSSSQASSGSGVQALLDTCSSFAEEGKRRLSDTFEHTKKQYNERKKGREEVLHRLLNPPSTTCRKRKVSLQASIPLSLHVKGALQRSSYHAQQMIEKEKKQIATIKRKSRSCCQHAKSLAAATGRGVLYVKNASLHNGGALLHSTLKGASYLKGATLQGGALLVKAGKGAYFVGKGAFNGTVGGGKLLFTLGKGTVELTSLTVQSGFQILKSGTQGALKLIQIIEEKDSAQEMIAASGTAIADTVGKE